jgi:hypothetical protein
MKKIFFFILCNFQYFLQSRVTTTGKKNVSSKPLPSPYKNVVTNKDTTDIVNNKTQSKIEEEFKHIIQIALETSPIIVGLLKRNSTFEQTKEAILNETASIIKQNNLINFNKEENIQHVNSIITQYLKDNFQNNSTNTLNIDNYKIYAEKALKDQHEKLSIHSK